MGREIERKYLVVNELWRSQVTHSKQYRQGYLCTVKGGASVRVRVADNQAWLNLKGVTIGAERAEYEYSVPVEDANEILESLCIDPVIEKTRYFVENDNNIWELDVFEGDNEGLVVAEIELDDVNASYVLPKWVGMEVTNDPKYYNASLVKRPFKVW